MKSLSPSRRFSMISCVSNSTKPQKSSRPPYSETLKRKFTPTKRLTSPSTRSSERPLESIPKTQRPHLMQ